MSWKVHTDGAYCNVLLGRKMSLMPCKILPTIISIGLSKLIKGKKWVGLCFQIKNCPGEDGPACLWISNKCILNEMWKRKLFNLQWSWSLGHAVIKIMIQGWHRWQQKNSIIRSMLQIAIQLFSEVLKSLPKFYDKLSRFFHKFPTSNRWRFY